MMDTLKIDFSHILFLSTFLLCLIIFQTGCYYDNEEELYAEYYAHNQCDTTDVSYSGKIRPIIETTCNTSGCHVPSGTANGIFINFAGVKEKVDNGSFFQRVVVDRDMPPAVPLTDCQIELISAWINQGAMNN